MNLYNMSIFPKNFLWGAATSSHQIEGNNNNDWTEWEKKNNIELAKNAENKFGNLKSWKYIKKHAKNPENYISGIACDHYNRYRDDFKIAKDLSHNAHKLSIEWSRIEPNENEFNNKEIQHYVNVINTLKTLKIEPFVTLWHWTIPIWLSKIGGINNKKFPKYFERYVNVIVKNLPNVKFWITLNEPTALVICAYITGDWPPQIKNKNLACKAFKNLGKAHVLAYNLIHKLNSQAQVGCGHGLINILPGSSSFIDILSAKIMCFFINHYFINITNIKTHDYIGIQQYRNYKLKLFKFITPVSPESDMGWELVPKGIYIILKNMNVYNKPLYITECGLADSKDKMRSQFLKKTIYYIEKALKENINVCGFFQWSLLDNFEWDKGYWPCFGLIEIDRINLKRTIRKSALIYKKLILLNS
jgi:beta-glucosidase